MIHFLTKRACFLAVPLVSGLQTEGRIEYKPTESITLSPITSDFTWTISPTTSTKSQYPSVEVTKTITKTSNMIVLPSTKSIAKTSVIIQSSTHHHTSIYPRLTSSLEISNYPTAKATHAVQTTTKADDSVIILVSNALRSCTMRSNLTLLIFCVFCLVVL
ncbi:hypothetical protein BC833DRAFT_575441 [Globomyces pollinis-pini]|nr:hypothetical protein BC833DRAFT_575441 [Globomyces pollinis-pini]